MLLRIKMLVKSTDITIEHTNVAVDKLRVFPSHPPISLPLFCLRIIRELSSN